MRRAARPNSKLLDLRDAEAEYGIPYGTLWQLVTRGVLPHVRLPDVRRIFVKRVDLEAFIEANTEGGRDGR